jgi:hypothetical protein
MSYAMPTLMLDLLGVGLLLVPAEAGAEPVGVVDELLLHAASARAPAMATAATFRELRKVFSFRCATRAGPRRIGSPYIYRDRTFTGPSGLFGIPL